MRATTSDHPRPRAARSRSRPHGAPSGRACRSSRGPRRSSGAPADALAMATASISSPSPGFGSPSDHAAVAQLSGHAAESSRRGTPSALWTWSTSKTSRVTVIGPLRERPEGSRWVGYHSHASWRTGGALAGSRRFFVSYAPSGVVAVSAFGSGVPATTFTVTASPATTSMSKVPSSVSPDALLGDGGRHGRRAEARRSGRGRGDGGAVAVVAQRDDRLVAAGEGRRRCGRVVLGVEGLDRQFDLLVVAKLECHSRSLRVRGLVLWLRCPDGQPHGAHRSRLRRSSRLAGGPLRRLGRPPTHHRGRGGRPGASRGGRPRGRTGGIHVSSPFADAGPDHAVGLAAGGTGGEREAHRGSASVTHFAHTRSPLASCHQSRVRTAQRRQRATSGRLMRPVPRLTPPRPSSPRAA
jgi:hypothetical protein